MGKHKERRKHGPKHGRKPKTMRQLRKKAKRRQKVEEGIRTIKIRRGGKLIEVVKPQNHNLILTVRPEENS